MMLILAAVLGLNFYLYDVIPKGFFPQQDTGRLIGVDPGRPEHLVSADAAEADAVRRHRQEGSGGRNRRRLHRRRRPGTTNSGFVFVSLKPLGERKHLRRRRDRAAAARDGGGAGRHAVPAGGAGDPRRRPRQQRAISIHAAGLDVRGAQRMDAEDRGRAADASRRSPTSAATSRTRACNPIW